MPRKRHVKDIASHREVPMARSPQVLVELLNTKKVVVLKEIPSAPASS